MTEDDDLPNRLTQLGLPEDEAFAYVTLLRLGQAKASDVSSASDLSRPKTYRALDGLRERGLVSATTGRPRRYHAADPHILFENLRSRRRLEIEEIARAEEDLAGRLGAMAGAGGELGSEPRLDVLRGRPAVHGRLRRMIEEADRQLDLIVSNPSGLRVLDVHGSWEVAVDAVARGVQLHLIVSPVETRAADRELLDDLGADIGLRYIADLPPTLFAIADGRQALVSLSEDASRRPNPDGSVAFTTDAETFVELQQHAFTTCWETGENASPNASDTPAPSPAI